MTLKMPLLSVLCTVLLLGSAVVNARELDAKDSEPVIKPEIERREVTVPQLHPRDFEFTPFAGILNIEDFGSNLVYGGRLGYHFTEYFFLEATLAQSTVTDTSFRQLGISVFGEESTPLTYYHLSTGINLFPGEIFFGRNRARYSYIYLVGGIGVTSFDILDNITFNLGFGVRVVPWDWLHLRVEVRDHMFESDLLGTNKLTHNIETTLGLSVVF